MIYVMSDVHGCYDKYRRMLEKIHFTDEDTLYLLGDMVDRGPYGMKLLLDIAGRENVVLLRGNHDQQAGILLSVLHKLEEADCPKELVDLYGLWLSDGGEKTLAEYLTLSDAERETVLGVLQNSLLKKELEVNGKEFLLAHTVPEADIICDYEEWGLDEYLLGEPDYEEVYFDDKYVVTGHTPTYYIDKSAKGRIWMGNHHIALDCGAVFLGTLGCLCLNTFEEFYVS
ncbi:MAG: metallophosphoesterase [Lachnospiraceae bacterium]|nr:metallophosphoesterase [Lachnospiraceae bacterium]